MVNKSKVVACGLSGGVDSAVSALLLKQMGYEVFGLFMKNWDEKDSNGQCQAAKDEKDVAKICNVLKIPYYPVNFTTQYYDNVFQDLLDGLKKGHTPNPDILCNKEIKFKYFLDKAKSLGADYLATGHYCQIQSIGDQLSLVKGSDASKDQTYFLYTLLQSQLENILFPIGSYLKSDIREIAKEHHLPVFDKKDSTGICFIGKRKFKDFISKYIPLKEGPILDPSGKVVGSHQGAFFYTIGQRKGLQIGGPGDAWYIADKDIAKNTLIATQGHEHPLLFSNSLIAENISWVAKPPLKFPYKCKAKIRYRQTEKSCTIDQLDNNHLKVTFDEPAWAVTLGQSIVFYQDSTCLGGGIITSKSSK